MSRQAGKIEFGNGGFCANPVAVDMQICLIKRHSERNYQNAMLSEIYIQRFSKSICIHFNISVKL